MPLTADTTLLPASGTESGARKSFKKADGVASTTAEDAATTAFRSFDGAISERSIPTYGRYFGLCPVARSESSTRSLRTYHSTRRPFTVSVFTIAVAQLP